MRDSDEARAERLVVMKAQEDLDAKGKTEQTLATRHAQTFVRPLAQQFGRKHTEDDKAARTIHEGLEAEEWHETLHDFATLFKIQKGFGEEAFDKKKGDPQRLAPEYLHQRLPLIDETR